VEVPALLLTVQRHVGGVDVENQLLGRLGVAGDELLHQHTVQCGCMRRRGPGLQATQGRAAGQRLGTAHRRLHHQVLAQHVVVAHVRPAQAQAVDALRQQAVHAVLDAGVAALVTECAGCCAGKSNAFIELLEQQHAAIADDVTTIERGLNDTASNLAEFNGLIGTLWHRQSSVAIGGQIPMTAGSARRLPTYCS
jgi:hypothetical protein